ncbi:MAG TPA: translation initiation factor IF-2 [Candidatus Paceibacterota bacterium]
MPETIKKEERPPVVAILGHIDHGKSTLLDYIRKTNIVATEAGAITQKLSAYVVVHSDKQGKERTITFLDTPGHEAFVAMRGRGISVADIAILVVSAEEGVKPQTLEALKTIKEAGIPYIVAINKIDKPQANVERTKTSLLEHEIFLEGMGGDVPFVPISAKSGQGVPELLDMLLLVADLAELKADTGKGAEGVVIEANMDPKKGIAATLIVKNGMLRSGAFVAAGDALAPTRIMQDFLGKAITEARPSQPVRIIGWSKIPTVGSPFAVFEKKRDAEKVVERATTSHFSIPSTEENPETVVVPVILKADTVGTLEAIAHEFEKLPTDRVRVKILQKSTGPISEGDIKLAQSISGTVVVGFNTPTDPIAADLSLRNNIAIQEFNVIYELTKWIGEELGHRRPTKREEEMVGQAKVLRFFSKTKDRQVIGCRLQEGFFTAPAQVRVMRREQEIGRGAVVNLQQQKVDAKRVEAGEFGAEVKSKIDIAPGDMLESFVVVEK